MSFFARLARAAVAAVPALAATARLAAPVLVTRPALLPALVMPVRTMKVHSSIRRLCASCQIVKRNGRLYVICKTKPRHKQRQG